MALGASAVEPGHHAVLGDFIGDRLHAWRAQLALGLAPKLRLGKRHLEGGHQALLHVALLGATLALLLQRSQFAQAGQQGVVDRLGERTLKSGDVRATLGGGNRVDEADDAAVVALHPPQGQVNLAGALGLGQLAVDGHLLGERAFTLDGDDLAQRFADGQVVDEVGQAALCRELLGFGGLVPRLSASRTLRVGTRKHTSATWSRTRP